MSVLQGGRANAYGSMANKRKRTAGDPEAPHDSGAEMAGHGDSRAPRRPDFGIQRVNVDFPVWMIDSLDHEARRLGVPRQSVIKFWISECLAGRTRGKTRPSPEPAHKPVASPARQAARQP